MITKEDLAKADWKMFAHLRYQNGSAYWYSCQEYPRFQIKDRIYKGKNKKPPERTFCVDGLDVNTIEEALAVLNSEVEAA